MTKYLQDLSWASLPEEMRNIMKFEYQCNATPGVRGILKYLFGYHNLMENEDIVKIK